MTPDDFHTLGSMIFGARWQTELSREVEVSDRTVRRWRAGKYNIPADIQLQIIDMAADIQVRRIWDVLSEIGSLPSEVPIKVYDQDALVPGGNMTAATHRAMSERIAEKLQQRGLNAFVEQTVRSLK